MRKRQSTAITSPTAPAWRTPLALAVLATLIGLAPTTRAHAATAVGPSAAAIAADEEAGGSTDRLIVKYRDNQASGLRSALGISDRTHASLQGLGLSVQASHVNAQGARVLRLSQTVRNSDLTRLASQLVASDPNVLYAEPDRVMQALAVPTDPLYSRQWHYFEAIGGMNLPGAWDLSTGSGVVVAVIDTGVRPHADLAANLLSGYDFISDAGMANDGGGRDGDASDPGDGCSSGHSSWHGTHVSGTIAAVANNGIGGSGIAWNAKILPVRALGCGGGYMSDIADGIIWSSGGSVSGVAAPAKAAKVINMSLGGQSVCGTTTQNAINIARGLGTTVVVAAGNSNTAASKFTPANCKGVITVAATGRGGARAPYSNFGPEVAVAAPGGNMDKGTEYGILSTLNDGTTSPGNDIYAYYQGTSMATPHVAGAVALMLGRNPTLTPDEIQTLLVGSVRKFPVACTGCGAGIVDATAAVKSVYISTSQATLVSESEPNDSNAQSQSLASLPAKVSGSLSSSKDVDGYRVSVPVNGTVNARLIANLSSNYTLTFRTGVSTVVGTSAKATGLADTLSWTNKGKTSVDLYVRVSFVSGGVGDSNGRYTLEVSR
jgi:serine protease